MNWTKWKKSLAAVLLCAEAAWGQSTKPMQPMEMPQNGILTLQEPGKPEQKCKIIRTFKTADGKIAYEVQDVKTGEKATITESGSPPPEPTQAVTPPSAGETLKGKVAPVPALKPVPADTKPGKSTMTAPATTQTETKSRTGILGWIRKAFSKKDQQTMVPVTSSNSQAMVADGPDGEIVVATHTSAAAKASDMLQAAAAKEPNLQQLQAILRDSLYPSQREIALETIAAMDWHADPNIVPILIQTAQEDCAATVRAASVRCLAKMHANTGPVMQALQKLQFDPESCVRAEVKEALQILRGN